MNSICAITTNLIDQIISNCFTVPLVKVLGMVKSSGAIPVLVCGRFVSPKVISSKGKQEKAEPCMQNSGSSAAERPKKNFPGLQAFKDMDGPVKVANKRVKRSTDQPILGALHHYSQNGGLFHNSLVRNRGVFQLICSHQNHPDIFYNFKANFENFLGHQAGTDQDQPRTLDAWERRWNVTYTQSTGDSDDVGREQWTKAFYISGGEQEVRNFLLFLDDFFVWRKAAEVIHPFPENLQFQLTNCCEDLLLMLNPDDMDTAFTLLTGRPDSVFNRVAAASPHWSQRSAILRFEHIQDAKVGCIFGGDTLSFRANFEACGVRGCWLDDAGQTVADYRNEHGQRRNDVQYYRFLPQVDLDDEAEMEELIRFIDVDIFQKTFVVCRWEIPNDVSPVIEQFRARLCNLSQVFLLNSASS